MNKITLVVLSLLGLSLFMSCTKDNTDIRNSETIVPIITGFLLTDSDGYPMQTIGYPNTRLGDKSTYTESNYYLSAYPNPMTNWGSISLKVPLGENITKYIWIVQAQYDYEIPNYSIDNSMINLKIGGSPLLQVETNSNQVSIDLTPFPNGYYRVYAKIGDVLLYDNIIIYKSNN